MSPWRPDSQCSSSGVRAVISECQLCQPCSSHRPPLGSETTGLNRGGEGQGGGSGLPSPAPGAMSLSPPVAPQSPLPSLLIHLPLSPQGELSKTQAESDTGFLKNFPWLPSPSRLRVKFLIKAFKPFLPSLLPTFIQQVYTVNKASKVPDLKELPN